MRSSSIINNNSITRRINIFGHIKVAEHPTIKLRCAMDRDLNLNQIFKIVYFFLFLILELIYFFNFVLIKKRDDLDLKPMFCCVKINWVSFSYITVLILRIFFFEKNSILAISNKYGSSESNLPCHGSRTYSLWYSDLNSKKLQFWFLLLYF